MSMINIAQEMQTIKEYLAEIITGIKTMERNLGKVIMIEKEVEISVVDKEEIVKAENEIKKEYEKLIPYFNEKITNVEVKEEIILNHKVATIIKISHL